MCWVLDVRPSGLGVLTFYMLLGQSPTYEGPFRQTMADNPELGHWHWG